MTFRRMLVLAVHGSLFASGVGVAGLAVGQEVEAVDVAPMESLTVSTDSDGFDTTRVRAGALFSFSNPWRYSGAAVQGTRYRQGNFREGVGGVVGFYRDQRRDTLAGVEIEAGVVRVGDKLRPIGDATWRLVPAAGTAVDLSVSADLIETEKAIARGIGAVFANAALEQQFGQRFTASGSAGWQTFNDGNARNHLRGRLIWLALPEQGITMQLRMRHFSSRQADVGGAYFNPEKYHQWLGVMAIRKRSGGWAYSAAAGAGRENIEGAASRASYLAEARAETRIMGNGQLMMHVGYYRSAAGVVDNPNYAFRQLGVRLIMPLR